MWLKAPNISCPHGFSTREGGFSSAPFDSLNLGGSEDSAENIFRNRKHALQGLDLSIDNLSYLKQVHGNKVCMASNGQQEGDALVSNTKNQILAISIADCYPILFHDAVNKVIGAAHAGWRGTLAKIAQRTLDEMIQLGAEKKNIQIAIGQGISQNNFEVGEEVIEQFRAENFPSACWTGRYLNLIACNKFVLEENGISEKNIWSMNRCTFEPEFFSYRQDKGKTGRMWGLISLI